MRTAAIFIVIFGLSFFSVASAGVVRHSDFHEVEVRTVPVVHDPSVLALQPPNDQLDPSGIEDVLNAGGNFTDNCGPGQYAGFQGECEEITSKGSIRLVEPVHCDGPIRINCPLD